VKTKYTSTKTKILKEELQLKVKTNARLEFEFIVIQFDSWKPKQKGFKPKYIPQAETKSLTSCSPVVRALVYQPSGPGFDSWHVSFRVSYYKGKNPNDAAATYLIFVNYILCFKS
jgi:hypothetical protein